MEKKQLVIIPGWGGKRETWQKFIDLAQNDFEVFFVDMPCFGDVECPKEVWGVDEYAEYVLEKTKHLTRPILLGHSFGGQVAVCLASDNPTGFSKLILSGAAAIRNENSLKRICFGALAKIGKIIFSFPIANRFQKMAKKVLYKVADSPDYEKTEGVKREIFRKIIHQDKKEKLKNILISTLVIWGSRDNYVSLKNGKIIAELIPNAEFRIIKDGKHGLHISSAQEFLQVILKK